MSVVLIGFGLICLLIGVASMRKAREFYANGQEVEAVVTEISEITWYGTDGRQARGFRAVYSYKDADGKEHQVPGNSRSTLKSQFSLGERKTVVINPDAPTEVLDEQAKVNATGTVYIAGSLVMIAAGVAWFIYGD